MVWNILMGECGDERDSPEPHRMDTLIIGHLSMVPLYIYTLGHLNYDNSLMTHLYSWNSIVFNFLFVFFLPIKM